MLSLVVGGHNQQISANCFYKDITIYGYTTSSTAKLHFAVGTTSTASSHIVMADYATLTPNTIIDATCDYNNDPTIEMDSTSLITVGMNVSGTGIPAGATVASITDGDTFELSASTTGGSVTNGTLTFTNYHFVHSLKDCPFSYVSVYNSDSSDTGSTLLKYVMSTHS